ncbi:MAG TPA: acyltransferase [Rhodanobacteraceae bacterium]|nr:acyltransferase [Rhodanobacteraceae bacterium]
MTESAANPATSVPIEHGRLRYIDALRGIAALLVLWLHVSNSYRAMSPNAEAHARWLGDFISQIDIGRIGVVVFFLISGFVIPFSIKPASAAPVAGFVIRRVFRIYPAYWLSVPLAAWVFYWMIGTPFGVGDFLVNLTLLQDVFGVPAAEGVYWTLLVEFGFYALCIALLLCRSLFSARRIAVLSASLALVHFFGMFMLWLGPPVLSVGVCFWLLNMSVMLWGTLYRLEASGGGNDRIASLLLRALAIFYALVLPVGATLVIRSLPNYTVSYALGFIVFIAGTRFLRMETRLTDWLGRISYSIYLFHPLVYQPIWIWLMQQPATSIWRTQHVMVYLGVNLLLTLMVASLVFRLVERPAIRLGHRIASRYEQRPSRAVANDARKSNGEMAAEVAAG